MILFPRHEPLLGETVLCQEVHRHRLRLLAAHLHAGIQILQGCEIKLASHSAGMSVLMGAPNIVRGKSHSGNIAARDLAEIGVLDVLSSDYVPFSLLFAPFLLADQVEAISLSEALRMVTATPARTVGLVDRGRIATGLRADLVRVHREDGVPVARSVWRQGKRVA